MAPAAPDPDRLLKQYRAYLRLVMRHALDRRLQAKVDLSGVVQKTLLEANQQLSDLSGWTDGEQTAWLRQAFQNNLRDEVQKFKTRKRDVDRECSLDAALEQSSTRLAACLMAEQSSPSQRAIRQEQLLQIAEALEQLSADQREAVELHYVRGWNTDEVARHLGRSKEAVAMLLVRGVAALRELVGGRDT